MYGMVNKAVEELVITKFGEDKWEQIKVRAGIDIDVFISNESYPDKITYDLVGAASGVLGLTPDQILEAFGEWWILKTGREGYGELLDATGKNVGEFLQNLPNFHARIVMIYPNLQPPKFRVIPIDDRSVHLHYLTHRPGLTQFVVGLLKGIGQMFKTPVSVEILRSRSQGAEHDEFMVRW